MLSLHEFLTSRYEYKRLTYSIVKSKKNQPLVLRAPNINVNAKNKLPIKHSDQTQSQSTKQSELLTEPPTLLLLLCVAL